MSTAINFASVAPGRRAVIIPATADTSLTAPTNVTTVVTGQTAGAVGTKVTEVTVIAAQAAIALGVIRLWLHDGTTHFLFDEIQINPAITGSNTATGFRATKRYENLDIRSGWTLRATTSIAQTFSISANAADY